MLSDLLARYSYLEPLIRRKSVLEVGAHQDSEGESTVKLIELGATAVSVWMEEEAYEIEGVALLAELVDAQGRPLMIDTVLLHGAERLADAAFLAALKQVLGRRGALALLTAPDTWPYEDIIAALQPHFPSIELHVETRATGHVFTPVGVDDPDVTVDGSLAAAEAPMFYFFVCAEASQGLRAQTVALLAQVAVSADEQSIHESEALELIPGTRDDVLPEAGWHLAVDARAAVVPPGRAEFIADLEARHQDAVARLAEMTDAYALASAALQNAELRLAEFQRQAREREPELERSNALQRENERIAAGEEELRRTILELESTRRLELDNRIRAEGFAAELEVRLKLQKSELLQRDLRIKHLGEEVQRLEADLDRSREDAEAAHAAQIAERDARRDTSARLQRDFETLRADHDRALREAIERAHAASAERDALDRELVEARQQLEGLRGHIHGVRTESVKRERELDSLHSEVMRRVDETESLKAECSMLRSSLLEAEDRVSALESREQELVALAKLLQVRADESAMGMQMHDAERERAHKLAEELSERMRTLTEELAGVRAQTAEHALQAADLERNEITLVAARDQAEQALRVEREQSADRDRIALERERLLAAESERAALEKELAATLQRQLEAERRTVGELRRELSAQATSSTTAPPAASSLDKNQEWNVLPSFHEDGSENQPGEKTRVIK